VKTVRRKEREIIFQLLFEDRNCFVQDGESINICLILDILKKNKVPLVYLRQLAHAKFPSFFQSQQFLSAYEGEKKDLSLQKEAYVEVKRRFSHAGIEDIFIKSIGFFPYKSDNLDILVRKTKINEARKLLREMGYIELKNVEEPYKYFFRKFNGGKSISAIHLHEKVAWINPFHNEDLLWERYKKSPWDEFISIPSIEDSIVIITAHWFYEDKNLKLRDLVNIYNLLKTKKIDWEKVRTTAQNAGWSDGLNLCFLIYAKLFNLLLPKTTNLIPEDVLSSAKQDLPFNSSLFLSKFNKNAQVDFPIFFSKLRCKLLHYKKTVKDKSQERFYLKIKELFLLTKFAFQVKFPALNYQPSFLISFSGVDGSGKTTHAQLLKNCFDICGIRSVYVWSRVGSSSVLKLFSNFVKYILRLVKKDKFGQPIATSLDNKAHIKLLKNPFFRFIYLSILLTEMACQYFLRIKLPLMFKKVVICDRYVFDTLAEIYCRFYDSQQDIESLPTKILRALTPCPDIAYFLDAPYDVAYNRKDENGMNHCQIKKQIVLYREMAELFKLDVKDTRMVFRDVTNQISYEVLNKYYEQFQ